MTATTGETIRSIAARDRLTYDDWKANEIRRFEDAGNTFWFADTRSARLRNRGATPPPDAFWGPMWMARAWMTGEAITWFDVDGNPRYTFADWQDLKRAERAAAAAEIREQAETGALVSLAYWRDLHDRRGEIIASARLNGATWAEIQAASGLSRMAAYTLANDYLRPGDDVPGVAPYVEPLDDDEIPF